MTAAAVVPGQLTVYDALRCADPHTLARTTDPDTSHDAAHQLSSRARVAWEVLRLLRDFGPMTDEELADRHAERFAPASLSGLRSRRSELVRCRFVYDLGERRVTRTGRRAIVWAAVVGA